MVSRKTLKSAELTVGTLVVLGSIHSAILRHLEAELVKANNFNFSRIRVASNSLDGPGLPAVSRSFFSDTEEQLVRQGRLVIPLSVCVVPSKSQLE